jgi:hypothetical protein
MSANKHDFVKGDHFTTKDASISGTIAGRHTAVSDGVRIPFISCDDVHGEALDAQLSGRAPKCFRAPAADLIYVAPTKTKPQNPVDIAAAVFETRQADSLGIACPT